jgi:two-component system, NarL family, response regulator LiaR
MSETVPIRILIVDDHDIVRRGLAAFLDSEDQFELVGEASNGAEALEACRNFHPDVVMMDIVMPVMDGVEATRRIRAEFPNIQVVVLTSSKEESTLQSALQAGATSYVLKNVSVDELSSTLRDAYVGKRHLSAEATQMLIDAATNPTGSGSQGFNLSNRELEVLALMVQGLNNPDIAEKLFISRSTVKFHISVILSKMGATSRTEAVALALRNGLVGS